jgi:hypothetical protein
MVLTCLSMTDYFHHLTDENEATEEMRTGDVVMNADLGTAQAGVFQHRRDCDGTGSSDFTRTRHHGKSVEKDSSP